MRIVVLLLIVLTPCLVVSQKTLLPKQVNTNQKGVLYKNEWSVDLKFHTNGLSIGYNKAEIQTFYRTKFYHFELGYLKDPREVRQDKNFLFQNGTTSKRFAFGKRNSVILLRAGLGRKYYLSEKSQKKGISVGYSYQVGGALAVLKPYYLELMYPIVEGGSLIDLEIRSEKYSEENADVFTNYERIIGATGFWKGFDDISIVPGGQANAAMHFAIGAFDRTVKAVEVGLMMDFFIKRIPILVETEAVKNKPYFLNLYVNLQFGKRSL